MAFLVFSIAPVSADTVYGKVYHWYTLEPVEALVIIKNGVEQRMLALNGEYSFEVKPGKYKIIARSGELVAIENVVVEGNVRFDIIVFPELEMPEEVPEMPAEEDYSYLVIAICLAGLIAIFSMKRRKKEEILPDDLMTVIETIKANGGRITQKELRKKLGFSEAKMSLILADLERRGIIEKVKKGRGNIIFLKNP
uniref:Winged helix-turn-helix transcriptional regulator n=1 Tax=Archaeoglobus fulgidus TaxID=2234 RepID=A0A7J2TJ44_ARCFL